MPHPTAQPPATPEAHDQDADTVGVADPELAERVKQIDHDLDRLEDTAIRKPSTTPNVGGVFGD